MRRGFTILELLVASLLLGMLTTILTMIFNQSSIAWRTGAASVADLDDVRDNIAELRDEADNAFVWNDEVLRLTGLWDENDKLNARACDAPNENSGVKDRWHAKLLQNKKKSELTKKSKEHPVWSQNQNVVSVGSGDSGNQTKTYTVNVKCAGPDKEFDTWDDIWSFPDDFN